MTELRPGRISYIQFTNPGAYPPLEHSSKMLAERGWDVHFLGTESRGSSSLELRPHPRVRVERLPFVGPGPKQKVHFARFVAWCVAKCRRFRPDWLYVSDPLAAPAGLLAATALGVPAVYHEHDSPEETGGAFANVVARSRRALARRSAICVLPNEARRQLFCKSVGRSEGVHCVWNCPTRDEVTPARPPRPDTPLSLYFHGNLGEDYFPVTLFQALGSFRCSIAVRIRGYDVSGNGSNLARIRALAKEHGLDGLEILPPVPSRGELWADLERADVGLALFPMAPKNLNVRHLSGASNKVFDYWARGLAVLGTASEGWPELIEGCGGGLVCDTGSAESIRRVVSALVSNPGEARRMGEAGRRRIETDWNYETQFAPVLEILEGAIG